MVVRKKISGKVWRFTDNVDTDQIIPAQYLVTGDPVELGKHAFENVRPEFATQAGKGDIIVADDNFGCGSSREHAPRALMGIGISCVIAKSFARIFYRNSINIGLPVIECDVEADEGDTISVDFEAGNLLNETTGKTYAFKSMPDFLIHLIDAGGLVCYVKDQLDR